MKLENICIITSPFLIRASLPPLSNLVTIVSSLADELFVITGGSGNGLQSNDKVHIINMNLDPGSTIITKIINPIFVHLKIIAKMSTLRNVDTCIFFMGERTLILPLMAGRLLNKRNIYVSSGALFRPLGTRKTLSSYLLHIIERINHHLSDIIILYSKELVSTKDYGRLKDKIIFAHRHFKNFNTFNIRIPLSAREMKIGYIGRFSEVKGILNFLKAILFISREHPRMKFVIGGDGELKNVVLEYIQQNDLNNRVELTGWITQDALPDYLNNIRLLILPSYTEGLPNVMLEAMACGTPVLATPVGMIPEVLTEGETGFIMKNNSPICIAENVTRALNSPYLEQIAENGKRFVEENFTFEKTMNNWKEILNGI